ncbi:MAG: phytoene desaturase family protein [Pseudotabrizicola sp.]|uniref:1-hydroxycarotenoid 3,4-desaturase CrtD n=1 Tax=Pseudotabrizicola sp. TaxID=2939647 RepID=UPI0027307FCC|nr:1-hydroxycarotenoid 3,4-desaturase CrtD [Pseudotabrizicola sp.]MDP2080977.1 phytoene desaturase family protein [Pseudotabrizicola sp.]MDZ7575121.1 phytoene desaturase family protein [Pseudotabrizicola sp.]
MDHRDTAPETAPEAAIVIGAGMGGLASAIRLAAMGLAVTVVDTCDVPGGKARALPSAAGPVDAGPTVLTMRAEFDALFALAGQRLDDHVTLIAQPILARHWWKDSPTLDLFADHAANIEAINSFAGPREAAAFAHFDAQAQGLLAAFDAPVMRAAKPDLAAIARTAVRHPRLWPALLPGMSLERLLKLHFRDPRLVQLFARYATYVGGRPRHAPGVLALIWRAEAAGVWAVAGGMHSLAAALARLAESMGVRFHYATQARRIVTQGGRVTGVQIEGGRTLPCRHCVFNGDPAALTAGLLGDAARSAIAVTTTRPRSLSAFVWAFAATPHGADLTHHNVFFTDDPKAEFGPIGRGQMPEKPTLYLCAQDRTPLPPQGLERFEIILNAPAGALPPSDEEHQCYQRTFPRLKAFGLTFSPNPQAHTLTTPTDLARLYPASEGAIYGRSPEGLMAAFQRPTARTRLPGLVLAGGGAHPGAGVPMAALSARHAAEAIRQDRISASTSAPTATHGGISTGSAKTARARFR